MPRNYYPTTVKSVAFGCLMLFPCYIVTGLIMWGCIAWGLAHPTSYGWTNFGVFMFYIAAILVMVYIYSAEKKKLERDFISAKIVQ